MTAIIAFVFVAALSVPSVSFGQQCLHGADESAEQKARRREALSVTRQVNTLQAQISGRERKFLDQSELEVWYVDMMKKSGKEGTLVFDPASDVIPGWQLSLNKTEKGYWFMVKDKTDPCGFAYISNQQGIIYTAEPIR